MSRERPFGSDRPRDGHYLSTLGNERKHKDAKSIGKIITATDKFDLSILKRMLMNQVKGLCASGDARDYDEPALRGEEADETHSLGPLLRPHFAAAQVVLGSGGSPCKHVRL